MILYWVSIKTCISPINKSILLNKVHPMPLVFSLLLIHKSKIFSINDERELFFFHLRPPLSLSLPKMMILRKQMFCVSLWNESNQQPARFYWSAINLSTPNILSGKKSLPALIEKKRWSTPKKYLWWANSKIPGHHTNMNFHISITCH